MHIKAPENSMLYIFGSFLHVECPADLDVLVIYDPSIVHPATAYIAHEPLFNELNRHTGLAVDSTLLTHSEAKQTNFAFIVGAVEYDKCGRLKEYSRIAGNLPAPKTP